MNNDDVNMQTFGEHLDVLRRMLFRIIIISSIIALLLLGFKDEIFDLVLAPSSADFITFNIVNSTLELINKDTISLGSNMELIATDISSQFIAHITMSLYIGVLCSSPYILYELFKYVSPALYDNERRYSKEIIIMAYLLFVVGLLVSYFLLFPISCQFLATYSVSSHVRTMVTLDSYLSLFLSLSLIMGFVFQLPIVSFFLAKMDLLDSTTMRMYRKHAFVLILVVAAIITPPDAMTLFIVSFPLYALYEVSILVVQMSKTKKIK